MSERSLLSMTAPTRDDFDIPYHDIGRAEKLPWVVLVGGIHGNELNGVFVLSRLANLLRLAAAGKHADFRLQRRVVVIPAVNVLGVNTGSRIWPFDKTDINRSFPGNPAGETTQRIAYALMAGTLAARHRIDIHCSNEHFEELPQVRLYEPHDDERTGAFLFGLPAIVERPMSGVFTSTLGHAWRHHGGENYVIQAGYAGSLQLHHCERLFQALINFLLHKGALSGTRFTEPEEDVHFFGMDHSVPVISQRAGLFVSHLEVGRWVRRGEVLGNLHDAFDGNVIADITSPVSGLLSGMRRQPLLCEGDLVARVQTLGAEGTAMSTYLHGQGQ
ncbi:MAG: M14 family metallopeptidase [Gammaproteobacteria bacterium]|nr:M14 family metallopeptidase [Gammaproteobacteria bacterium]